MLDRTYQSPVPSAHESGNAVGVALLSVFSGATALLGVTYLVLSITVILLPNEIHHLGIGVSRLCGIDDCRLVGFLSHGRMSNGGALVAVGVMTGWLTAGPLRRREPWAWWTLLLAGAATYGSFLTFLAYGYLEPWHTVFVGLVSAVGIAGLVLTRPHVTRRSEPTQPFGVTALRTLFSTAVGRGRLMIAALAVGVVASGISILMIASSVVFVPQDTAFLGLDSAQISTVSDSLVPIMAHDRAGFGGGMLAIGILFAATAWNGLYANARGAWRALAISGFIFYTPTLAIHLAIEYTSFIHLLPVYGGLTFLSIALFMLWVPVHRDSNSVRSLTRHRQPDLRAT